MKPAYNWTRELSPERLRRLDNVKRSWETLFGEPDDRGHYARIQWGGSHAWNRQRCKDFQAVIHGKQVTVHLHVVTAREWFVREAYNRALALTRERYPDFEAHHFIDGDRVGERRIVFASDTNALSSSFLWHQIWRIIEEQKLQVSETWRSEPCNWIGWTANQICTAEPSYQIKDDHLSFTVVRALDEIDNNILQRIENEICARGYPDVSDDKLAFGWEDVREGFVELSDPELVALNWADARPVPTSADIALYEAATGLDIHGIRKALAAGANPNITVKYRNNMLATVVIAWGDHLNHLICKDSDLSFYGGARPERKIPVEEVNEMLMVLLDAGAHPNCFSYGETPVLVDAVLSQKPEIVRLLLERGADPTICAYWDEGPGMTPSAWFYASTDGFTMDEEGARECYYEMIKTHPAPWGTQQSDEQDRKESELPDYLRSWHQPLFSAVAPISPTENHSMPLTELDAATAFARAWNRLDPEAFLGLLAPDAHYASQWVFEELESRKKIADYLRVKMRTVSNLPSDNPNRRVRAELTTCHNGQPCVAMTQGEGGEITAVVVFTIEGEVIKRYDMCMPQLMEPQRSGVYPI